MSASQRSHSIHQALYQPRPLHMLRCDKTCNLIHSSAALSQYISPRTPRVSPRRDGRVEDGWWGGGAGRGSEWLVRAPMTRVAATVSASVLMLCSQRARESQSYFSQALRSVLAIFQLGLVCFSSICTVITFRYSCLMQGRRRNRIKQTFKQKQNRFS